MEPYTLNKSYKKLLLIGKRKLSIEKISNGFTVVNHGGGAVTNMKEMLRRNHLSNYCVKLEQSPSYFNQTGTLLLW